MNFKAGSAFHHWIFSLAFWAGASISALASGELQPPADPAAKAVFDILDRTCARCHQTGRLEKRDRPAKGFGNVLQLDEISQNRALVVPGNPYASKLFKQIVDKDMPYDVYTEFADSPSPTADDIKALETWINSLAPQAGSCESAKFVSKKDIVGLIARDLESLPRNRATGTRYLTLTHFKNICTGQAALKVYAQGAVKLLNSLSRSSDTVRLEAIDPDQTILRFNIDDLGWRARDWDMVLAGDPYAVVPDTQMTNVLEGATGTKLPFARADWFAFAASRPPLYDRLLNLPSSFPLLAQAESVNVDEDIRRALVKRAGFQKSGVSANNRLIERHGSRSGYFWTSYDFAGNRENQSLFEFPLGPGGANGFHHDGGETIFSLPNGFQGYYLNNSKGQELEKGPTIIVRDPSTRDFAVENGISCMGCHDQGMRKAKDDIRAAVLSGRLFSKDVRDTVIELYPDPGVMDGVIEEDQKKFTGAMVRAGLDPLLKLNGVEMINALSKRFEDDLDGTMAAAELGLTKDEFEKSVNDADKRLRPLLRRLQQGLVPRDQFETAFKDLVRDITDDTPLDMAGTSYTAHPASGADLSLTSDKDVYRQGDTPVFTVLANSDCFLTLTDVDEKGEGTVLFPNKFQQNNRIRANAAFEFPSADAPFQYRMSDRGIETIIAVCSEHPGDVDGIKHDFKKADFTAVDNYTRALTRLITVEAKDRADHSDHAAKYAPATGHEVLRSAIKLDVR